MKGKPDLLEVTESSESVAYGMMIKSTMTAESAICEYLVSSNTTSNGLTIDVIHTIESAICLKLFGKKTRFLQFLRTMATCGCAGRVYLAHVPSDTAVHTSL